MRKLLLIGIVALAGCSADTTGPAQPVDDGWDDWDDSEYDSSDDQDDSAADDATQDEDDDAEEDALVPPDDNGAAHHSEVEPNDDVAHPTFIGSPDCTADAALDGDDDSDWFSVEIEEPGTYVFMTSTGELDDDEATDTRLELYSSDDLDDAIASDDDAGEGSASRLSIDLDEGTYYIRVFGYTTATVGEYTIHALYPDSEDADDDDDDEDDDDDPLTLPPAQEVETESNGTLESADSLGTAPSTIAASLDARDVDHFAFLVDRGMTIVAETGPDYDSDDDGGVDTYLEILDADGRVLGEDDDGSDVPMFSRVEVDLPEAGLYYAKVSGYDESSHGTYSLSID